MSRPSSPENILWETDADGVLFTVDRWMWDESGVALFAALEEFEHLPALNYESFVELCAATPGKTNVEKYINALDLVLADGRLPLSRRLLTRVGESLMLFEGVKDTMRLSARTVEEMSQGTARLRIAINSCGFQPVLAGLSEISAMTSV